MKIFLMIVLAVATVWDAFTTIFGTIQILGDGPIQIGAAVLFSALIFGFVINTKRLLNWRSGFVSGAAKFFWVIALCYDLYTSWVGNSILIIRGRPEIGTAQFFILIGLTLLVTASPIIFSAMWQQWSSGQTEQSSASQP